MVLHVPLFSRQLPVFRAYLLLKLLPPSLHLLLKLLSFLCQLLAGLFECLPLFLVALDFVL